MKLNTQQLRINSTKSMFYIIVLAGRQPTKVCSASFLYLRKGTNFSKQGIVVYPNVIQYKEERTFLRSEAKGVQTETVSVKFDEGTQCEEENVVTHARGVQTSPAGTSSGSDFGNPVKKRCPLQNQHPLQCLASTATTTLMHTTTSQLSSSDTMTLIASTAAAAAIAASASLHNNNTKHAKVRCLFISCIQFIFSYLKHFIVYQQCLLFPKPC